MTIKFAMWNVISDNVSNKFLFHHHLRHHWWAYYLYYYLLYVIVCFTIQQPMIKSQILFLKTPIFRFLDRLRRLVQLTPFYTHRPILWAKVSCGLGSCSCLSGELWSQRSPDTFLVKCFSPLRLCRLSCPRPHTNFMLSLSHTMKRCWLCPCLLVTRSWHLLPYAQGPRDTPTLSGCG